jgi:hypothetical protein
MEKKCGLIEILMIAVMCVNIIMFTPQVGEAHCDTLGGPVVLDARKALEKGDIIPLLKWVRKEDESNIRAAFEKTLTVRSKGPESKELADMYFFETIVRIHRAGEGASYSGLKPAEAVDPAVALADKALASDSVDKLVNVLTKAIDTGIRKRFAQATEAKKQAEESIEAGRKFIEAYVIFTHYIERLHADIAGHGGHHGKASKGKNH